MNQTTIPQGLIDFIMSVKSNKESVFEYYEKHKEALSSLLKQNINIEVKSGSKNVQNNTTTWPRLPMSNGNIELETIIERCGGHSLSFSELDTLKTNKLANNVSFVMDNYNRIYSIHKSFIFEAENSILKSNTFIGRRLYEILPDDAPHKFFVLMSAKINNYGSDLSDNITYIKKKIFDKLKNKIAIKESDILHFYKTDDIVMISTSYFVTSYKERKYIFTKIKKSIECESLRFLLDVDQHFDKCKSTKCDVIPFTRECHKFMYSKKSNDENYRSSYITGCGYYFDIKVNKNHFIDDHSTVKEFNLDEIRKEIPYFDEFIHRIKTQTKVKVEVCEYRYNIHNIYTFVSSITQYNLIKILHKYGIVQKLKHKNVGSNGHLYSTCKFLFIPDVTEYIHNMIRYECNEEMTNYIDSMRVRGINAIKDVLQSRKIQFVRNKTFDYIENELGNPVKFDFYFELNGKKIVIEFDGITHFTSINGVEELKKIRIIDFIKTSYCQYRSISIHRINYKQQKLINLKLNVYLDKIKEGHSMCCLIDERFYGVLYKEEYIKIGTHVFNLFRQNASFVTVYSMYMAYLLKIPNELKILDFKFNDIEEDIYAYHRLKNNNDKLEIKRKPGQSIGEKFAELALNMINVVATAEKTFPGLIGLGGGSLKFDFYFESNGKKIIVEVDGPQHFEPSKYFAKDKNEKEVFEKSRTHDFMKMDYCVKNSLNMIRICDKHKSSIDNIIQYYLNVICQSVHPRIYYYKESNYKEFIKAYENYKYSLE